ncbi:trehalase-like [Rhynchophorus ferrugineus]|uniref:trehalase-like n=1 Tax=Rhynchophorus ferrugineus TaxID=354439 RepID=UPI003FCCD151
MVQMARIYSDSKTFVDLSQINSEDVTLENFDELMRQTDNNPTREQLQDFLARNFESTAEMDEWTPPDFTTSPELLNRIDDAEVRKFTTDLVAIWPTLGRKVSQSVFDHPDRFSLIGVPNGIIIPGGRFKEFYYWDTYWIIEGLLLSDMKDTARGMIENLLSMVKRYGFVPNGGRVYYLNRSQPPLLTLMASLYMDSTNDQNWLKSNIELLDEELTYWLQNKMVTFEKDGISYTMAHYISESNTPRPESYYEDINTCNYFTNSDDKRRCYQGLKSGAETGWDFSSRWLFDSTGGSKANLTFIEAQRVIPVDLNAFLYKAFYTLSDFYSTLGDAEKSLKWKNHAKTWINSIQEVLYDSNDGIWYDFDPVFSKPRRVFYPSNFAPLWAEACPPGLKQEYGHRAAEYFARIKIDDFKGGIPTSLDNNGEQWDLPNAWPPLQEIVILGLWKSRDRQARRIARQSGRRWIKANMRGFEEENAMFEKYDAIDIGKYGGGGEYEVQKGFGWTNGVALKVISMFYTRGNDVHDSPIDEAENDVIKSFIDNNI